MGVVEQIIRRPQQTDVPFLVERVTAVAGRGLEGDFRFMAEAEPGEALTLISAEAIEAFRAETGHPLAHEETRRQVLTRGVDLNSLVGRRFRVGAIECEGVELCEPCNHLVKLTGRRELLRGLVHRGGLRADILTGGEIAAGDPVEPL
jgi:MOSC domain-containing protein YiiM